MKISNPFDCKGSIEIDGEYKAGTKSGNLSPNGSGKAEVTVPVPWKPDTSFDVSIVLNFEYKFLNLNFWLNILPPPSGFGQFAVMAKWRATLSEDGLELQALGSARPTGSVKSDGDIVVAVDSAQLSQSTTKAKRSYVNFEVSLLAGYASKGVQVGYKGVSTTVGGDSRTGGAMALSLIINFDVEKPPAPKRPVVKVLKFKVGPYEHSNIKTADIKKSTISEYYTWSDFRTTILKLPQATLDEWDSKDPQILGGKTIKITGYADTTGPMSENDSKYGKGRAEDVKKWIQTWTGASDSFFLVKSMGEGKSGGTDKKADEKKLAKNRYVDVELSYIE